MLMLKRVFYVFYQYKDCGKTLYLYGFRAIIEKKRYYTPIKIKNDRKEIKREAIKNENCHYR